MSPTELCESSRAGPDPVQVRARLLALAELFEPRWRPAAEFLLPLAGKLHLVVPIMSKVLGVKLGPEALQLLRQCQRISLVSWKDDLAGVLAEVPDPVLTSYVVKIQGAVSWVADQS